jgi:protein-tyrosine phosphatase
MHSYSRSIKFEAVLNFRDLGGYRAQGGRTVTWRRLFRSGELHNMTSRDIIRLKEEIGLRSVIDLRGSVQQELLGVGPLNELEVRYYKVPLSIITESFTSNDRENEIRLFRGFSNSGEGYLYRVRKKEYGRRIVDALEIIAEPDNHPLVFHCNAGKDRSGILAAIVLGVLGVADEDIIEDYTLTAPYMKEFIDRWNNDLKTAEVHKNLPEYQLKASPESMVLFLSTLKKEYGSVREYVMAQGAEASLIHRLEKALLT